MNDLLKELFPPDLKPIQRWRIMMALVVGGLLAYTVWGHFNYARADDLKQLQTSVNTILVLSLETRIRDLAAELCTTKESSKRVLQGELDSLQVEHKALVSVHYEIQVKCAIPLE